jgi:hypothetical protein
LSSKHLLVLANKFFFLSFYYENYRKRIGTGKRTKYAEMRRKTFCIIIAKEKKNNILFYVETGTVSLNIDVYFFSVGVRISCTNTVGKGKKSLVFSNGSSQSFNENIVRQEVYEVSCHFLGKENLTTMNKPVYRVRIHLNRIWIGPF